MPITATIPVEHMPTMPVVPTLPVAPVVRTGLPREPRVFIPAEERIALAECEAEIESGFEDMRRAWRRISVALAKIHTGRLYRAWCDTFDEYVESRWGLPRSSAYEWLEAAGVMMNIERHATAYAVVIDAPSRISHARELAKLPADQQAPALEAARKLAAERGAVEPTRYEIARVVTNRLGEPEPKPPSVTAHEREQRALAEHVRRIWQRLDADVQAQLLKEFQHD